MNIDFAFLTSILFGFRLLFGIAFVGVLCLFAINTYKAYKNNAIDFYWGVKWFFIVVVVGSVFAFASSGIATPKGDIRSTYQPKPLVESIQIETPPARVEYMDGFEPLKNDK